MDERQQVVKIYASHAKTLLAASFCGIFAAGACLYYFVWPTPSVATNPWIYQEPFKTAFFIIWLLLSMAGFLAGLYWTVTPMPILQLDTTGLIYQPYPLKKRSVYWADLHGISVFKQSATITLVRIVRLTLWFHIKPHTVFAYGSRSRLEWSIA
jgi:hypothetical protein